MNQESFNKFVDEIISHGYDEKVAAHFAMLIGDNPAIDSDGNVIVIEENKVLAKLKLNFFNKEK